MPTISQKTKLFGTIGLLGLVLCAYVFAHFMAYSQNTLLRNPQWKVGKREILLSIMRADETLLTRTSVASNRLDLGAWNGFQWIHSRESFTPGGLKLQAMFRVKSYVSVIWGAADGRFSGLRISNFPGVRSGFFQAGTEGGILEFQEIPFEAEAERWMPVELRFDAQEVVAKIGEQEFRSSLVFQRAGQVGFWGSHRSVLIDDVQVSDGQGSILLQDDFSGAGSVWWRYWVLGLFFLSLLFAAVAAFEKYNEKRAFEGIVQTIAVVSLTTLFTLGIIFLFDFFYWSHLPLSPLTKRIDGQVTIGLVERIEAKRAKFFEGIAKLYGAEPTTLKQIVDAGYQARRVLLDKIYCRSESGASGTDACLEVKRAKEEELFRSKKQGIRILFSGSSQTFGSGASTIERSFVARVHQGIVATLPRGTILETFNSAMSAAGILAEFRAYQGRYSLFQPDVLVLNWSHNDAVEDLQKGTRLFVEEAKRRGAKVLVVLEPVSFEVGNRYAVYKHSQIREALKDYDVPILDLQSFLDSKPMVDRGFLWWDIVHLTDIGHKEVAQKMIPEVLKLIGQVRPKTR